MGPGVLVPCLLLLLPPQALLFSIHLPQADPEHQSSKLRESRSAKEEETSLNNLVSLLQDMVEKIPTQGPVKSSLAATMINIVQPFPSSTAPAPPPPPPPPSTIIEAVLVPVTSAAPIVEIETGASTPNITLLSNDNTTAASSANATEESEMVPHPTSSAYISDNTVTGPFSPETTAMEQNTSLVVSLVSSLKTGEEQVRGIGLEASVGNHSQAIGANILTLINQLMGTIRDAPASVLQDPALHKQVEIAENYLKNALDLAAEAEKKLQQGGQSPTPAQPETLLTASSHESQTQVDIQLSSSASTVALQSNVESGASSETSHKPQAEGKIEVVSTVTASPNEPPTELMLKISSETSTSSEKPQAEEAISPSASSHESQTEISSEPSTSIPKPQTDVKIAVLPIPSTSSLEPQKEDETVSKPSSLELQTEVVLEVISTPATSHAPQTEVQTEAAFTPTATPPESQREMEIGLSTPSAPSHESQMQEVLQFNAESSPSSPNPNLHLNLNLQMTTEGTSVPSHEPQTHEPWTGGSISNPSESSPESQTEVMLEINSETSTAKVEIEENIVSTPSTSAHEPQTEVVHEITSESSTSIRKPQTEVRIEILTVPSTTSPGLQTPTSSHEPQTEVKVEVTSIPSATPPAPHTEVEAEGAIMPTATSHERQVEVVPEGFSEPSQAPGSEVVLEIHPTPSASSSEPQTQMVLDIKSTPLASEEAIVLSPSSPESAKERAQDLEVDMGKLKAFVNLLYGFTPQLTADSGNLSSKEASKAVVERVLEVVDAIKDVFCGNKSRQSKKMLKQLLEEDTNLVKQAMKTESVP